MRKKKNEKKNNTTGRVWKGTFSLERIRRLEVQQKNGCEYVRFFFIYKYKMRVEKRFEKRVIKLQKNKKKKIKTRVEIIRWITCNNTSDTREISQVNTRIEIRSVLRILGFFVFQNTITWHYTKY